MDEEVQNKKDKHICGFCRQSGAKKRPHPSHWPGEKLAGTEFVHAACENIECVRKILCTKEHEKFFRGGVHEA
jgi:hypothetical protein